MATLYLNMSSGVPGKIDDSLTVSVPQVWAARTRGPADGSRGYLPGCFVTNEMCPGSVELA